MSNVAGRGLAAACWSLLEGCGGGQGGSSVSQADGGRCFQLLQALSGKAMPSKASSERCRSEADIPAQMEVKTCWVASEEVSLVVVAVVAVVDCLVVLLVVCWAVVVEGCWEG